MASSLGSDTLFPYERVDLIPTVMNWSSTEGEISVVSPEPAASAISQAKQPS